MSEMRYDWMADRWVIFAPNREDRPNEFASEERPFDARQSNGNGSTCRRSEETASPGYDESCPFCFGNESKTSEASLTLPAMPQGIDPQHPWRVRVVDNRFPAVLGMQSEFFSRQQQNPSKTTSNDKRSILFHHRKLIGSHEVLIESPQHHTSLTNLDDEQVRFVFRAYQQRIRHWLSIDSIQYVVLFKNVGVKAGASLSHTHSQLIAMDFLPSEVTARHRRLSQFQSEHLGCALCATLEEELGMGERIVFETESFVSYCPYASPTPFLVFLMPRSHGVGFDHLEESHLDEFAMHAIRILRTIEQSQRKCHYNFVLHTPRPSSSGIKSHWYLEIVPRLTQPAGFEWGSDCYINPCYPEHAAKVLRDWKLEGL